MCIETKRGGFNTKACPFPSFSPSSFPSTMRPVKGQRGWESRIQRGNVQEGRVFRGKESRVTTPSFPHLLSISFPSSRYIWKERKGKS